MMGGGKSQGKCEKNCALSKEDEDEGKVGRTCEREQK